MPNPYANKVVFGDQVIIDLTNDDVLPADVRQGVHFHGADGAPQIGTSSGGGGTPYAIISVTYPSGSVCTCAKGSTVLTAEDTSGKFNFGIPEAGEWTLHCTDGSDTAVAKVTASVQYEIIESTLVYIVLDPVLNNNSWEDISKGAVKGAATDYWSVGDRKTITIDTIGTFDVYILGFNHDGVADTIDFGGFKRTSDGRDITLYSYGMNEKSSTANGWKDCNMRNVLLGSTDVSGGDATVTCATVPVSGSMMSKLPSDLRNVMKPMTIWTNNVNGGNNSENAVTASVDYLPLLAEYEVFGKRTSANPYESNHQTQYAYYAAGNSKLKYRQNGDKGVSYWWERSPGTASGYYCHVTTAGGAASRGGGGAYGASPIFRI